MPKFIPVLSILFVLLLGGCALGDYRVARQTSIDKEIATARAETTAHLALLNDQQLTLLRQSIATHEAREQAASDYLTKAAITFMTLKTPSRPEMVMGQSVQQTAAQLPAASAAAQIKAMQDLKTELDETRISTEALRAQYDAQLTQARAEGAAKEKALADTAASLKHVDEERVAVLTQAKDTEAKLSDARKVVDDAAIAAKTKEAEDAKSTQAIRTKLSAIVGGLALLCLAGAIWSPVWKEKFGAACALLALVAVGIWWVQPWHVALAVAVGVLAIALWAVKNHYIESKAATATYQALASVKDTAAADYDRLIKPALTEWQSKYAKDGTLVPDKAIEAHIDQRLMQVNAK